jgi:hypothetical protein
MHVGRSPRIGGNLEQVLERVSVVKWRLSISAEPLDRTYTSSPL